MNVSFYLPLPGLLHASLSIAHVLILHSSQIPGPLAYLMFQAFRGNKLEGAPRAVGSLASQPLRQTTYCCLKAATLGGKQLPDTGTGDGPPCVPPPSCLCAQSAATVPQETPGRGFSVSDDTAACAL